jgi:sigma-E factor negative regulatory protein RseB
MRLSVRFSIAVLLISFATARADDTAEGWLERMATAVEFLNYEGSIVYMAPGRAETFKVYHRVAGDDVTERLVALDGAGAEIIRNAEELICIFPKSRSVVVESRGQIDAKQPNPLRARLPAYSSRLEQQYALSVMKSDRVLDRSVAVVDITPRDAYRYGYRIWLDTETAMPLKTQLIGEDASMPIEEIRFTEISMPDLVPQSAVQTGLDTSEFTWRRHAEPADTAAEPPMSNWRAREVPPGFQLTRNELEFAGAVESPRIHLVYSDGLATVSVFIDMAVAASDQVQGLSMIGAANAYSVMRAGLLITAMGEVPPRTVERLAMAMEPEPDGS